MEIKKTDHSPRLKSVEEALSANRSSILRIQIFDEGTRIGNIGQDFLLSGLLGLSSSTVAVIGIANRRSRLELQNFNLSDKAIEEFLLSSLSNFPGIKSVDYSEHVFASGCCYVVHINWYGGTQTAIREALGASFVPKTWNRFLESVHDKSPFAYSKSSLETYIEKRQAVDPDALEARFDPHDLPTLLGLEKEPSTKNAAIAAFGSNGGVQGALYVRSGIGHKVHSALGPLTEGTDRQKFRTSSLFAESMPPINRTVSPATDDWHDFRESISQNGYSLGTGIFAIIENVSNHVCRKTELFSEQHPAPVQFDENGFAEAVRELIVNTFCHGHWDVSLRGRDDEWYEGNRVAIVHLGDRLEVINRTRKTSHLPNDNDYEAATRRSALHEAFKDIKLAKGRSVGQKLVRRRLVHLGMPSPIFVRTSGYYRAIAPIVNNFTSWGIIPNANEKQKIQVAMMYVARLALSLTHLNEEIVSSVFYTQRPHARVLLQNLRDMNVLEESAPKMFDDWAIKASMPTFSLTHPQVAKKTITEIEAEMKLFPSIGYLSPGGVFQVSIRSMMNLVDRDREIYIQAVYDNEIILKQEAAELTKSHMELLRSA
ncbi:hypothetical protein ACC702_09345 [Rhizobium ruizarguesonis]